MAVPGLFGDEQETRGHVYKKATGRWVGRLEDVLRERAAKPAAVIEPVEVKPPEPTPEEPPGETPEEQPEEPEAVEATEVEPAVAVETLPSVDSLSRPELQEIARKHNVRGFSAMRMEELADLLVEMGLVRDAQADSADGSLP